MSVASACTPVSSLAAACRVASTALGVRRSHEKAANRAGKSTRPASAATAPAGNRSARSACADSWPAKDSFAASEFCGALLQEGLDDHLVAQLAGENQIVRVVELFGKPATGSGRDDIVGHNALLRAQRFPRRGLMNTRAKEFGFSRAIPATYSRRSARDGASLTPARRSRTPLTTDSSVATIPSRSVTAMYNDGWPRLASMR